MTPDGREVVGGVDTHSDLHVAAAIDAATGQELGTAPFPTTSAGYAELHRWLSAFGALQQVGVESTGHWGAGLARYLAGAGVEVVEVDRPDRKARRTEGKSDTTDALSAARAVLSGRAKTVPKARDGLVEAIRALSVSYGSAVKDRTRAINEFKALLTTAPESIREALRPLGLGAQLAKAKRWTDSGSEPVERETRWSLKELARRIIFLGEQADRIEARQNELAAGVSPALLGLPGVGPQVAAGLLAAMGDNPERLRSEACFAKLCGACPLPASSGKTTRHRLNPGGDRGANKALYTIVIVRMKCDPATRAYVVRRTQEGKSKPEIIRCLKRFVAREVYQVVVNPPADLPSGLELRFLRLERKLSLREVCCEIGTTPTRLSAIERGVVHDTRLAIKARDWLMKSA